MNIINHLSYFSAKYILTLTKLISLSVFDFDLRKYHQMIELEAKIILNIVTESIDDGINNNCDGRNERTN